MSVSREMQVYIRVTPGSGEAQEAPQQPHRPHGGAMWFILLEIKRGNSGDLPSFVVPSELSFF